MDQKVPILLCVNRTCHAYLKMGVLLHKMAIVCTVSENEYGPFAIL